MNAQLAPSLVREERTASISPATATFAKTAQDRPATSPRPSGLAQLRRWFTRTFDFRDAFTPTAAW